VPLIGSATKFHLFLQLQRALWDTVFYSKAQRLCGYPRLGFKGCYESCLLPLTVSFGVSIGEMLALELNESASLGMCHTKRVPSAQPASSRPEVASELARPRPRASYIGNAVLHTILVTAILAVMIPFFNISTRDNQQDMLSVQPYRSQTSSGGVYFPQSLSIPFYFHT
jgi:hypothetical protein